MRTWKPLANGHLNQGVPSSNRSNEQSIASKSPISPFLMALYPGDSMNAAVRGEIVRHETIEELDAFLLRHRGDYASDASVLVVNGRVHHRSCYTFSRMEIPFSVIPGAFVGFAISVPFKLVEVCESKDLFVRLLFLLVVASLAAGALVGFVVGMLVAVPSLAWLNSVNPKFPYLSQYDDYRTARDLIAIASGVIVAIGLTVFTVTIARNKIGFHEQSDGHQAADQPL